MFHLQHRPTKLEMLESKLQSVTKLKLSKERHVKKLCSLERSLCEAHNTVEAEIELLTKHLEDLNDEMSAMSYQVSRIIAHKAAEASKLQIRIGELKAHKNGFDYMFEKERDLCELRNKELQDKQAEEEVVERQKQKKLEDKNDQECREVAGIEQECDAIEQKCAVLKKRNKAIMLNLKRKLLVAEDARRKLMNEDVTTNGTTTTKRKN